MKDQIRLLRDCFHNEIPAVVFQGNDSCAGEILEAAKKIYQKHGCSQEFLYDWQMLINEVKAYQQESPEQVQLPQLTHTGSSLTRTRNSSECCRSRCRIYQYDYHASMV